MNTSIASRPARMPIPASQFPERRRSSKQRRSSFSARSASSSTSEQIYRRSFGRHRRRSHCIQVTSRPRHPASRSPSGSCRTSPSSPSVSPNFETSTGRTTVAPPRSSGFAPDTPTWPSEPPRPIAACFSRLWPRGDPRGSQPRERHAISRAESSGAASSRGSLIRNRCPGLDRGSAREVST